MTSQEHGTVTEAGEDPRRPPPLALQRLLSAVSAAERLVGAAILTVLLLLVLLQSGMRFLPVGGWVWTGELARFCLVWLTFSLSGYLMQRNGHITLELVDLVARGRTLWAVKAFANVVITLACAGFVVESLAMVADATGQASPAMGVPLTLVYTVPLAGFALTTVRAAVAIVWRPAAERSTPGAFGAEPVDSASAFSREPAS